MRTYTSERTYRDLTMPNTTTTCFRTPIAKEVRVQPASKAKQAPHVVITKVSKNLTFLERVKKTVKKCFGIK